MHIYDKKSFNAIPLQIKSRTSTIGSTSTVHFEVRKKVIKKNCYTYFVFVLLKPDFRTVEIAWLFNTKQLLSVTHEKDNKYFIRPSKSLNTKDRYQIYQCENISDLV